MPVSLRIYCGGAGSFVFSRTLLLPAAADGTGDLPAARILAVANLVGDQRADAAGGDVTDLAAGRDHAQPLGAGALDRVQRRLVDGHAHEDEPELVDHGRVRLRLGAHLDSRRIGEAPFARI